MSAVSHDPPERRNPPFAGWRMRLRAGFARFALTTLAGLILAAIVWVAAGLRAGEAERTGTVSSGIAAASFALVGLILVQIALGGLVAGSRAGWTYNTWPLMDGHLLPPAAMLFSGQPWIENFVDNPLLVQFNHRLLAYAVVAIALWHAYAARRAVGATGAAGRAAMVAGLSLAQAGLGIVTLLLVVPLWAGLAHQLLAMALLAVATHHARLCRPGAS